SIGLGLFGELDAAREACDRALALHRAAGRMGPEVDVLVHLATVQRVSGDLGSALQASYDALAYARRLGDARRESNALLGIGTVHLGAGELERAIDVFRELDRAFRDTSATVHPMAISQMAKALVQLGDDAAAEPLIREGIDYWASRGWRAQGSSALSYLAEI